MSAMKRPRQAKMVCLWGYWSSVEWKSLQLPTCDLVNENEDEEEKAPTVTRKPLEWDEHIPTYNGKQPFCPEDYWKLPNIDDKIENGTPVLVLFTTSTYEYKGKAYNRQLRKSASMNVKAIVL